MKKSTKVGPRRASPQVKIKPLPELQRSLTELREKGAGTIEGVTFDLKPNELLLRGWEPDESVIGFLIYLANISLWPAPGFEDTEIGVFMEPGGGSWRDGSLRESSSLRQ